MSKYWCLSTTILILTSGKADSSVVKRQDFLLFFLLISSIQVSRETLYTDLQKLLMKEMAHILHDDILISAQKVPLFKIRVLDCLEGDEIPPNPEFQKRNTDNGQV